MKEEEITNLKRRLAVVEHEIGQYENMANFHFGKVQDYKLQKTLIEQELAELQKPKYTAKDFPCLNWDDTYGIIYLDDDGNQYSMRNGFKQVQICCDMYSSDSVDKFIDIVECKLSDIKEGDYFALIDIQFPYIGDYRYCTKLEDNRTHFDYADNGYISKSYANITSNSYSYVKFILRNK